MAGLETVHRIVEKIEVAGTEQASTAFDKLGGLAGLAAKALGLTSNVSKDAAKGVTEAAKAATNELKGAGEKGSDASEKGKKGWSGLGGTIFKSVLAANLAAKAFSFVVGKAQELIARGLQVNKVYSDMEDSFAGLTYATADFGKISDPMEQFEVASKAAVAETALMEKAALRVAVPLGEMASLGKQLQPLVMATGGSMLDVAKTTEATAAASKVLGVSSENVLGSMRRILATGKAQKTDTIGQLIASKAGVKATDDQLTRVKKLQGALQSIGAPIKQITKGTGDALQRWETLSDGILRRVTKPIYDKIGEVVSNIVGWTEEHEGAINKVTEGLHVAFEAVWGIGKGIWDIGVAIVDWVSKLEFVKEIGSHIANVWSMTLKVVDLIGHGFKIISALLVDSGQSMDEMNTLFDSAELKVRKIWSGFLDSWESVWNVLKQNPLLKMLIQGIEKLPWAKDLQKMGSQARADFEKQSQILEKSVADREKRLGMAPTTDIGRREAIGMSEAEAAKIAANVMGKNRPLFQQNIAHLEIKQDFRDQDPDRVMIEFTRSLERLGENALQSAVGGAATAFGPGSSM